VAAPPVASVKSASKPKPISLRAGEVSSNIYTGERGAVFTRREVVDFILDLSGYTTDQPLYRYRLLEPSFGEGAFLLPVVERLLISYTRRASPDSNLVKVLAPAIRAVEIHASSVEQTRSKLRKLLQKYGVSRNESCELLSHWLVEGDFLRVIQIGRAHV